MQMVPNLRPEPDYRELVRKRWRSNAFFLMAWGVFAIVCWVIAARGYPNFALMLFAAVNALLVFLSGLYLTFVMRTMPKRDCVVFSACALAMVAPCIDMSITGDTRYLPVVILGAVIAFPILTAAMRRRFDRDLISLYGERKRGT